MEKFNRQEQLKQLHAERKVKTEKKVDKAINDLVQKNKEINFNIVSKHSKVSKATLYKNNKITKEHIYSLDNKLLTAFLTKKKKNLLTAHKLSRFIEPTSYFTTIGLLT